MDLHSTLVLFSCSGGVASGRSGGRRLSTTEGCPARKAPRLLYNPSPAARSPTMWHDCFWRRRISGKKIGQGRKPSRVPLQFACSGLVPRSTAEKHCDCEKGQGYFSHKRSHGMSGSAVRVVYLVRVRVSCSKQVEPSWSAVLSFFPAVSP